MPSNRFNRRRANRGTPPICASKPIPPLTPAPYGCIATFNITYIEPPPTATLQWSIYVPDLLTLTPIDCDFFPPAGTAPIPRQTFPNGDLPMNMIHLLPPDPGTYVYRLEFSYAGRSLKRIWASVTSFPI